MYTKHLPEKGFLLEIKLAEQHEAIVLQKTFLMVIYWNAGIARQDGKK